MLVLPFRYSIPKERQLRSQSVLLLVVVRLPLPYCHNSISIYGSSTFCYISTRTRQSNVFIYLFEVHLHMARTTERQRQKYCNSVRSALILTRYTTSFSASCWVPITRLAWMPRSVSTWPLSLPSQLMRASSHSPQRKEAG